MGKLIVHFHNDSANQNAEISNYINHWFLTFSGGPQLLDQALKKGDIQVEIFLYDAQKKKEFNIYGNIACWKPDERKIFINSSLSAKDLIKVFQLHHAWFKKLKSFISNAQQQQQNKILTQSCADVLDKLLMEVCNAACVEDQEFGKWANPQDFAMAMEEAEFVAVDKCIEIGGVARLNGAILRSGKKIEKSLYLFSGTHSSHSGGSEPHCAVFVKQYKDFYISAQAAFKNANIFLDKISIILQLASFLTPSEIFLKCFELAAENQILQLLSKDVQEALHRNDNKMALDYLMREFLTNFQNEYREYHPNLLALLKHNDLLNKIEKTRNQIIDLGLKSLNDIVLFKAPGVDFEIEKQFTQYDKNLSFDIYPFSDALPDPRDYGYHLPMALVLDNTYYQKYSISEPAVKASTHTASQSEDKVAKAPAAIATLAVTPKADAAVRVEIIDGPAQNTRSRKRKLGG
jgi:hypothetical protein